MWQTDHKRGKIKYSKRIDHHRVRHGEEPDRSGAEQQRRHRDERIGGVKIATDQEPGDDGAEAPATQTPFVQQIQIASAPTPGEKAKDRDHCEQDDEDDERGRLSGMAQRSTAIDERDQCGADQDPQQLIPVEKRNAGDHRFGAVIG